MSIIEQVSSFHKFAKRVVSDSKLTEKERLEMIDEAMAEIERLNETPAQTNNAADLLVKMADTYRERNAVYGDNYKMVGRLMAVLFPDGAPPELLHSHQFHLFELKLVKLSRFAISGLQHIDSIHDDGVYSAMIESILTNKEE